MGRVVAANLHDLPDQRTRGKHVLTAGHQEDGLDVTDDEVGHGDLQLGVEVDGVSNPPQNNAGPDLAGKLHRKITVGLHLDIREVGSVFDQHLLAFLRREHLLLDRVVPDGNNQSLVQPGPAADDIQMAVGERIEHTRKDRNLGICLGHSFGIVCGGSAASIPPHHIRHEVDRRPRLPHV